MGGDNKDQGGWGGGGIFCGIFDHLYGHNISHKNLQPICDFKHGRKFIFKLFDFKIKLNDRYAIINSSRKCFDNFATVISEPRVW